MPVLAETTKAISAPVTARDRLPSGARSIRLCTLSRSSAARSNRRSRTASRSSSSSSFRAEEPRRFGAGGEPEPAAASPDREAQAPQTPQAPPKPLLDLSGDHGLTDDQVRIVCTLGERTLQVDDIIEETEIPARRVLSALTMLELDGVVEQSSGKRFALAVTLTGQEN